MKFLILERYTSFKLQDKLQFFLTYKIKYLIAFYGNQQFTRQMLPYDQQKLIGCLLSAIPLSYLMTYIKNPTHLLLYTIAASAILQMISFEWWILLLWLQQNVVYMICKLGPRAKVGRLVLIQTFIMLIGIQLLRMYQTYGIQNVDITAIYMMQVFQYISFAYNYQDGLFKQSGEFVIKEFPSYLQYLGFVMFVPSCLVGPVFQFKDFQSYLYKTGVFQAIQPGFSLPAMRKQLKTTILSVAVFILLMPFPISNLITPWYTQLNFFMQAAYLLITIMGARFKYYTAWSLGMVAMHATGFTYNPQTQPSGKIVNKWDRIVVSNIWDFEMDPSMKKKADGWNIPIQTALKRYIYDRINKSSPTDTPKQKKKLQIQAQQKTLAVSALWHGLYPGYFLAFFHWALILQISQQLYRIQKQSPRLRKWRHKLKYLELFLINYFLGVYGVCFQLMTWQKISIFFSAILYIPVIITYVANILIVRMAIFSKKALKLHHKQSKKTLSESSTSQNTVNSQKESDKTKVN